MRNMMTPYTWLDQWKCNGGTWSGKWKDYDTWQQRNPHKTCLQDEPKWNGSVQIQWIHLQNSTQLVHHTITQDLITLTLNIDNDIHATQALTQKKLCQFCVKRFCAIPTHSYRNGIHSNCSIIFPALMSPFLTQALLLNAPCVYLDDIEDDIKDDENSWGY